MMTDTIDHANAQTEQILAIQIKNATTRTVPNAIVDCVNCGEPIGEKRKAVAPYAVRCIDCQRQFEKETSNDF